MPGRRTTAVGVARFTQTGRDSWSARSGYVRQSAPHARFVRPEGEMGVIAGAIFTGSALFLLIAGILAICAIRSAASGTDEQPVSQSSARGVEAVAGQQDARP